MPLTTRTLPPPIILAAKATTIATQSGVITVGTTSYQFPLQDGTGGTMLRTDGQGHLEWVSQNAAAIPVFTPVTVSSTGYLITSADNFIRYMGPSDGTMRLPLAAANPGKQIIIENLTENPLTIIATSIDNLGGDMCPIVLDSLFSNATFTSNGAGNWIII